MNAEKIKYHQRENPRTQGTPHERKHRTLGNNRSDPVNTQETADDRCNQCGDCGPQMSRELGLWDTQLYDYESVYKTEFTLSKADRLIYGQSSMNHAMLFTGVDIVDGEVRRWRVENSWGEKAGKKGFFIMNDSWFDEYMFEIAAEKSRLPEELQEALKQEPIVLPPWDPMGSLAR